MYGGLVKNSCRPTAIYVHTAVSSFYFSVPFLFTDGYRRRLMPLTIIGPSVSVAMSVVLLEKIVQHVIFFVKTTELPDGGS